MNAVQRSVRDHHVEWSIVSQYTVYLAKNCLHLAEIGINKKVIIFLTSSLFTAIEKSFNDDIRIATKLRGKCITII